MYIGCNNTNNKKVPSFSKDNFNVLLKYQLTTNPGFPKALPFMFIKTTYKHQTKDMHTVSHYEVQVNNAFI